MKAPFTFLIALFLTCTLRAQAPAPTGAAQYTPEQLDQLLAPIALYPDPLVAVILPASTVPSDVALAAQFIAGNGDPSAIDAQPWDPSVKALAHYPEVVKWMNDNADWMGALGAAFAMQPTDVMESIQQLRAKAQAAGTLVSTPQQQVVSEGDDIRIVPAQDNEIYVPQYDPNAVYDDSGASDGPYLTFGVGYPVGPWLGFECDWDNFGIWFGPWQRGWAYRRDWRNPGWGGSRWHVDPARGHELVRNYYRPEGGLPRARPIPGARIVARPAGAGSRAGLVAAPSRPDYRGWNQAAQPRPSTPAPSSPLFGGYTRGTQARDFSNRGHTSRQAPVRSNVRSSGARAAPPPSGGGRDRH